MSERLGLRGLYVLGLLLAGAISLVIALVQEPVLITLVNGLGGVSYVLRYTAVVLIVGAVLPARAPGHRSVDGTLRGGRARGHRRRAVRGIVVRSLGGAALFLLCAGLLGPGRGHRVVGAARAGVRAARGAPPARSGRAVASAVCARHSAHRMHSDYDRRTGRRGLPGPAAGRSSVGCLTREHDDRRAVATRRFVGRSAHRREHAGWPPGRPASGQACAVDRAADRNGPTDRTGL